ncbi:MAG: hypothetical protein AABN95_22205 [Acidobacteriota bacterium]
MSNPQTMLARRLQPDVWLGIAIFVFTLFVFLISRVHQVADSSYSMTLSQGLLDDRTQLD